MKQIAMEKSANEKGIRDVVVSDSVNVGTTNDEGVYQINYLSVFLQVINSQKLSGKELIQ